MQNSKQCKSKSKSPHKRKINIPGGICVCFAFGYLLLYFRFANFLRQTHENIGNKIGFSFVFLYFASD